MGLIKYTFATLSVFILMGCKGAGFDSGFAPGAITHPPPATTTTSTNHVKYGQTVTTSNGWQVSNDNSDPVEQKTLSNGWTVEVKYE